VTLSLHKWFKLVHFPLTYYKPPLFFNAYFKSILVPTRSVSFGQSDVCQKTNSCPLLTDRCRSDTLSPRLAFAKLARSITYIDFLSNRFSALVNGNDLRSRTSPRRSVRLVTSWSRGTATIRSGLLIDHPYLSLESMRTAVPVQQERGIVTLTYRAQYITSPSLCWDTYRRNTLFPLLGHSGDAVRTKPCFRLYVSMYALAVAI
jgi:hypothetical protein